MAVERVSASASQISPVPSESMMFCRIPVPVLLPEMRNILLAGICGASTFMKGPKTYLNMDGEEVAVMHTGKSGVRVGRLDLTLEHK